jgi:hypothetical protein
MTVSHGTWSHGQYDARCIACQLQFDTVERVIDDADADEAFLKRQFPTLASYFDPMAFLALCAMRDPWPAKGSPFGTVTRVGNLEFTKVG